MSDAPIEDAVENTEEQAKKLSLDVKIDEPGTCQRHVTVTVAREDIDRYFEEAIDEMVPQAEVPGFRVGRAPKKLVAARFKDQVKEQVKGGLLMDSMEQVTAEADFSAISEPSFDYNAVSIPDSGPLTFEFDIEVRPEFDVPTWEGLSLERPVREIDDEAVTKHLNNILLKYGEQAEVSEVEAEDWLDVDLEFSRDGKVISKATDERVRVRPTLSFGNAEFEGFDKLVVGGKKGSEFTAKVTISDEDADESLQNAEVDMKLTVRSIRRDEAPQLTPAFLERIGGFEDEGELREVVEDELKRQFGYHQQRRIREQISAQLTKDADWELPPDLLRRQAGRELERAVMELESSGFSMEQINSYANQLRRNSLRSTEAALKEHFILERIAEALEIEAAPEDYDAEIALIAMQRNEPPRRVRARMEKRGQLDTLRNQIIERRVIEAITEKANFTETPFEEPAMDTAAVNHMIGHRADIAEAEHNDQQGSLSEKPDYS